MMFRKKLDFEAMIRKIDSLVNTEKMGELELKLLPRAKPFTQAEAENMMEIIGKVYAISHCISCEPCQNKWVVKK
jgi:hypothetical protein